VSTKISSDPEDSNQSDEQGPQADATDAAALGRAPQGAPGHGGCLFLPDTPCAREL